MANRILITGGSGLVGSHLAQKLSRKGYQIALLSRSKDKNSPYEVYTWNISKGTMEQEAIEQVDYIIHLAGAGVADKRWTDDRKKVLASSRIDSAQLLHDYLKKSGKKIRAFISASAIGIYGFDTGGIAQTEDRKQLGDDFLATLTKKWEEAADEFIDLSDRIVKLRIGLVLSAKGGLLDKLIPITKLGLGSAFGTGEQFMSWIHMDDLVDMFIKAVEDEDMEGIYNAVAPKPVTNQDFIKELSNVLGRPFFLPNTPKFLMKAVLGELASAVTGGNKVSSEKIEQAGFKFMFPTLSVALSNLLLK